MNVLISLFKNQSGVTAIEYSLIAALIAVAAIASMTTIGASISTTFNTVAGKLYPEVFTSIRRISLTQRRKFSLAVLCYWLQLVGSTSSRVKALAWMLGRAGSALWPPKKRVLPPLSHSASASLSRRSPVSCFQVTSSSIGMSKGLLYRM